MQDNVSPDSIHQLEEHILKLQDELNNALNEIEQLRLQLNTQINTAKSEQSTNLEELKRTRQFITSLSHVAVKIETERNPDDVLEILGKELTKLGFYCFIGEVNLEKTTLTGLYTSFESKIITMAEKIAGFSLQDYKIPLTKFDYYEKLFLNQEPIYIPDVTAEVKTALQAIPGPIVTQVMKLLKIKPGTPSISVPMLGNHKTKGMLSVWGENICEGDTEALVVFGNQVTIALDNAQLINQVEKARDELEKKVEDRTSELRWLQKEREQFIARVSHDLRTPIAAIMGFSQLLTMKKWGEVNAEQEEKLIKIAGHAERLDHIVDDLLSVSRIEAGATGTKKDVVNLNEIIFNVINEMAIIAKYKTQHISFHNKFKEATVLGDSDGIYEVLINLVDNALKYNSKNGNVLITSKKKGNMALVEVKDSGIGLKPKEKKSVFEAFYRAEMAGELRIQGTGLGLSIVKKLINQMSGDVWVTSKGTGKGCTFSFTLPMNSGGQNGK